MQFTQTKQLALRFATCNFSEISLIRPLNVGYGHGETERKRASLLETQTIRVRSIFTLLLFVSLGLLLAVATDEEPRGFRFLQEPKKISVVATSQSPVRCRRRHHHPVL